MRERFLICVETVFLFAKGQKTKACLCAAGNFVIGEIHKIIIRS